MGRKYIPYNCKDLKDVVLGDLSISDGVNSISCSTSNVTFQTQIEKLIEKPTPLSEAGFSFIG